MTPSQKELVATDSEQSFAALLDGGATDADESGASHEDLQAANEKLLAANRELKAQIEALTRQNQGNELRDLAAQLEQQTRLFDTTLTSISDFAYIFNRAGRFEYSNQPLLDLLQISFEEIVGKNFFDLEYPAALAHRLQNQIEEVFAFGKAVRDDTAFLSPAGENKFYEYIFAPVFGDDGQTVDRVAGSTRDVTDRTNAENEVRKLNERLQIAMNAGQIFSWEINPQTRHLEWSSNTENVVGFPLLDNIDRTFELIHPDDIQATVAAINRVLENGGHYESEYRLVNPANGEAFWFHSQGALQNGADGQPRFVGITQNITQRKQNEEALLQRESLIAADLVGMRRLYELQSKLADQSDVRAAFRDVLAVACEFTGTDRGCVQMLSADGARLEMFVWQGYADDSAFISFFRYEGLEMGCEVARVQRQRLIIEDTAGFPGLEGTGAGEAACADAIRAAQSTPMVNRAGETIGVISTQFRHLHRPSEHELRLMDMLAWTAGEYLERHRADAALRESEGRMRRALSIDTVGVLFFGLDGRMHDANEAFGRMCGYTVEELRTTTHWEKLTATEFIEPTMRIAQNLAERGESPSYEKQMIRPDGTRWWGLFAPTRLSGSGRESECVEFIIDITQRKVVEEALSENRARLQKALEIETVGVVFFDDNGVLTDANDAYLKMIGFSREQLNAHIETSEITLPEWMPRTRQAIAELETDGRATPYEKEMQRPDGSRWWGLFAATRLAPNENVEYVLDMSAQHAAETSLRASEERYRVFIEGVEDYAIYMMDAHSVIVSWNSGVERVLGYAESEFIGQNSTLIFTPEDCERGEPQKELATAAREGRAPDERWHVKKNGERFFASGVMMALRDENGDVRGFAKILRDMTIRKRMEDELKAARDDLEQRVLERTAELRREVAHRQRAERAREQLLQRVVTVQEEERLCISRELHDQMGQQLTALLMGLKSLPDIQETGLRPPSFNQRVENMQEMTNSVMEQMHRLAWELRPAALDTFGLEPALRQYVQEWSEQSAIQSDFVSRATPSGSSGSASRPSSGVDTTPDTTVDTTPDTTLYRVVQEALNNVQRHAKARQVSVLLEHRGADVVAIVEDDGCGFEVEHDESGNLSPMPQRLGLLGMMERLELVGGTLTIESSPESGTTVYARVSLNARKNER